MLSQNPYKLATFTQAAPDLARCPNDSVAEVAFAGRSNAGKSSAINTLTGNKKLARTSKTPGRTQLINYFAIAEHRYVVDLPGYGYAKVPMAMKKQWDKNLSIYLQEREPLMGLVLMMDSRHPMQAFDTMMLNWAIEAEKPTHILLTKSDKLSKNIAKSTLLGVKKSLKESNVEDLVSVQSFSSLKKQGVGELVEVLNGFYALADDSEPDETVVEPAASLKTHEGNKCRD